MPLSRSYQYDWMYYIKQLKGRFATDTLSADMKLLHMNMWCQVYSHKHGFTAYYPQINTKGDSLGKSIDDFVHDLESPEHLIFDGFSSKVGKNSNFYKNLRKYSIKNHVSAPRRRNKTPAEGYIREIKRRFYRIMERNRVPKRVWDYLTVWVWETGNLYVSIYRYANVLIEYRLVWGTRVLND